MSMWLKEATASQEICLGRFVDATDGDTEMTALTIANTDIKLFKHGATSLTNKNSGGATHMANGLYYAVLDATDTNTLGHLEVHVHVATALAVRREYMVVSANVYDSLIAAADNLQVDMTQVEGSDATNQIRDSVVDDSTRIDASALNTLSSHDPGGTIASSSQATAIAGQLPAALTADGNIKADALRIDGNATAATNAKNFWANIETGTAQGGDTLEITLAADENSGTDFYKGAYINILGGTGVGQTRRITAYNGTTKVATVDATWVTTPSSDSVYQIFGRN